MRQAAAKNKVDRAHHAEGGPQKVEFQRLLHVKNGETGKYDHGDDFLDNLELA